MLPAEASSSLDACRDSFMPDAGFGSLRKERPQRLKHLSLEVFTTAHGVQAPAG
jgi:hypothetical protein